MGSNNDTDRDISLAGAIVLLVLLRFVFWSSQVIATSTVLNLIEGKSACICDVVAFACGKYKRERDWIGVSFFFWIYLSWSLALVPNSNNIFVCMCCKHETILFRAHRQSRCFFSFQALYTVSVNNMSGCSSTIAPHSACGNISFSARFWSMRCTKMLAHAKNWSATHQSIVNLDFFFILLLFVRIVLGDVFSEPRTVLVCCRCCCC